MTDTANNTSDKLTKPFKILRQIRAASPEVQDRILVILRNSEAGRKAAETLRAKREGAQATLPFRGR